LNAVCLWQAAQTEIPCLYVKLKKGAN